MGEPNSVEDMSRGNKGDKQFGAGEDIAMEGYVFPPDIENTRIKNKLQSEILANGKEIVRLNAQINEMIKRSQEAKNRMKEINKDGKQRIDTLATTLDMSLGIEKLALISERDKLEEEQKTLQAQLDEVLQTLPPEEKETIN